MDIYIKKNVSESNNNKSNDTWDYRNIYTYYYHRLHFLSHIIALLLN